jgi:hypothetical protein
VEAQLLVDRVPFTDDQTQVLILTAGPIAQSIALLVLWLAGAQKRQWPSEFCRKNPLIDVPSWLSAVWTVVGPVEVGYIQAPTVKLLDVGGRSFPVAPTRRTGRHKVTNIPEGRRRTDSSERSLIAGNLI